MNTLERTIRPTFIKMLESSPLRGGNIVVYEKALQRANTTTLEGLMIMAPLLGATNCKKFRAGVQAVLLFRANKSISARNKPLSPLVGSSRDLPPVVEEEVPFTCW